MASPDLPTFSGLSQCDDEFRDFLNEIDPPLAKDVIHVGKHKGTKFTDLCKSDPGYIRWLLTKGKDIDRMLDDYQRLRLFLLSRNNK